MVAGIGNIYTDEILFATGIDPACPACLLDHGDWERLAEEMPRCIGFFVEKNVVSPEEWMETDGKDYRNTPYIRVYGHAGMPCPVCGTPLVRERSEAASASTAPGARGHADDRRDGQSTLRILMCGQCSSMYCSPSAVYPSDS